jgi:hypothetical protein
MALQSIRNIGRVQGLAALAHLRNLGDPPRVGGLSDETLRVMYRCLAFGVDWTSIYEGTGGYCSGSQTIQNLHALRWYPIHLLGRMSNAHYTPYS